MNRGDRCEPIFNGDKDRLLHWSAEQLRGRRKSDPQKIRVAARLRRETTMTLEWIADRLCMGAATHVASLLHRQSQKAQNSEETLF